MYQPLTDRAADFTHIKPVPGLIVSFVLVMIIWKVCGVSGLPSVPSDVMASSGKNAMHFIHVILGLYLSSLKSYVL